MIIKEYMSNKKISDAVNGVREMRAPKHFLPEMLSKIIVCLLDSPDDDKEHVSSLFQTLRSEGLITGENFMQVGGFVFLNAYLINPSSCIGSLKFKVLFFASCCRLFLTFWTSALSLRVTFPW